MRHATTICIALLCLAASIAHGAADFVANVNGTPITRAALERALNQQSGTATTAETATRTATRDRLIAEELIWQKAQQAGVADPADRPGTIARFVARNSSARTITEQDVRAQYERIVASLGKREYRISLIQAADHEIIRKADEALQRGEEFAQVARQFSRVPSAARGGELDWVSFRLPLLEGRTNGIPPPIASAIAAMKPGQLSAPIRLDDGWALVRLDAERATVVPSYDEVKPALERRLAASALEAATRDFVVTLLKGAQIRVFE